MQLSRGWYGLVLFWTCVVALGGIGAGTLQVLGSPSREEHPARTNPAEPTVVEYATRVPLTPFFAAVAAPSPAPGPPIDVDAAAALQVQEAPPTTSELTAVAQLETSTPDVRAPIHEQDVVVANVAATDDNEVRPETTLPEKRLHLRIVGESKPCPRTDCYRWRVVRQRAKHPRPATIDLVQLHLAPGLREAAENGEVELMIDAVERHTTIKGRDVVTIVATRLAGVTPHDASP